jgi:hypothetical protein
LDDLHIYILIQIGVSGLLGSESLLAMIVFALLLGCPSDSEYTIRLYLKPPLAPLSSRRLRPLSHVFDAVIAMGRLTHLSYMVGVSWPRLRQVGLQLHQ